MTNEQDLSPTAAVLLVGDEILSGRTQDANLAYIAKFLAAFGIDVCEARVVRDVESEIAASINALRERFTYVFTTGGIGPTHDDITADAVGRAFGVAVDYDPEALALLAPRYEPGEFNEMRRRMARVPDGAVLIRNSVSAAPGFQIANVFVLAGVPIIMRAMLEDVEARLAKGRVVISRTISAPVGEGRIAARLAQIQRENPVVAIGSYPFSAEAGHGVQLVMRGRDGEAVEKAAAEIEAMLRGEGVTSSRVDG
ncbi:MAG TPA: molybdopterin-binding protein [Rhizomicrobium sp.]|jgi:molybdenum cofactor synthesis domain-containing protein|nr:molybdopterin-binding protein [Rhizomicrobium sp.]